MQSSQEKSENKPPHDESAFVAWGCIAGGAAGTVVGIFAGHWVLWAIFLGVLGLVIGALVDRSRR